MSRWCCPPTAPCSQITARARQLIQHHEYRKEEIRDLIRRQPKTAYDIALEVFGVDNDRPLFHMIAATFETLAHLHLL